MKIYELDKTISASTDAMPIKFTESQKLRESYNK